MESIAIVERTEYLIAAVSGSGIDAPDDKIKLPQPVVIAQTLWDRFPAEIPEQVDP